MAKSQPEQKNLASSKSPGAYPVAAANLRRADAGARYLSVSVGKDFGNSANQPGDEPIVSPEELKLRIRDLTDTAQILMNRGLRESAFASLMKAYLLDPLNPDVLRCEKRVLPAWELTKHSGVTLTEGSQQAQVGEPRRKGIGAILAGFRKKF